MPTITCQRSLPVISFRMALKVGTIVSYDTTGLIRMSVFLTSKQQVDQERETEQRILQKRMNLTRKFEKKIFQETELGKLAPSGCNVTNRTIESNYLDRTIGLKNSIELFDHLNDLKQLICGDYFARARGD